MKSKRGDILAYCHLPIGRAHARITAARTWCAAEATNTTSVKATRLDAGAKDGKIITDVHLVPRVAIL